MLLCRGGNNSIPTHHFQTCTIDGVNSEESAFVGERISRKQSKILLFASKSLLSQSLPQRDRREGRKGGKSQVFFTRKLDGTGSVPCWRRGSCGGGSFFRVPLSLPQSDGMVTKSEPLVNVMSLDDEQTRRCCEVYCLGLMETWLNRQHTAGRSVLICLFVGWVALCQISTVCGNAGVW